jgi:hypothetical protein
MRMLHRLTLLVLAALWISIGVAAAQNWTGFVVDGDPRDWRGSHDMPDLIFDVVPTRNLSIDMRNASTVFGEIYADFDERDAARETLKGHSGLVNDYWKFVYLVELYGEPFSGSEESSVELLIDMHPDLDNRNPEPDYSTFSPDYRIEITGKDGSITQERLHRWEGGRWQTREGNDLPDIESAVSGNHLEGSVPWSSIGGRRESPPGEDYFFLTWSFRASQGDAFDIIPDDKPRMGAVIPTSIDEQTWGGVKVGHNPGQ